MKRIMTLLTVLIVLGIGTLAVACPMCKDSVPTSDAQSASTVPVGFNLSVYTLLGAFLTVLGLVVGGIMKAVQTTPVVPRDSSRSFPLDKSLPPQ